MLVDIFPGTWRIPVVDPDDLVRELGRLASVWSTPGSPVEDASGADLTGGVLDQLRGVVLTARNRSGHEYVLPSPSCPVGDPDKLAGIGP